MTNPDATQAQRFPTGTHLLTRAKNMFNPSEAVVQPPPTNPEDHSIPEGSDSSSKKSSLGASIKKKFNDVKRESIGYIADYSRSHTTLPHIVHSHSAPAQILSSLLPPGIPAPSFILGTSASDLVASPLPSSLATDTIVPVVIQKGTPMTKVSANKKTTVILRLDPDQGQILWQGKRDKIIPIESIKELRAGADAKFYREQFHISQDYEDRWLTIVYIIDAQYKTLHLIAATKDVFQMWDSTLRKLHAIRQELMSGTGNFEMRQAIWERQYWKGADVECDQKLDLDNVERLCRRLNLGTTPEDLDRHFQQADTKKRGYLDFDDFRRFVKLLKARPDIDRLYKKLCATHAGTFDFSVFEKFMRVEQKSMLSEVELQHVFDKYTRAADTDNALDPFSRKNDPPVSDVATMTSPVPSAASPPTSHTQEPDITNTPAKTSGTTSEPAALPSRIMTLESFTTFLLSPDNAAFADQNKNIWHDMTRPLAEYYISSSHNTYLVGHQLVGVSTIEGYIRALLHSCRSVELDIYDGDTEPMIYHGKTFTSKVSLRDVCVAIAKYAFVASPYPVIISAEVHCCLAQQDMIAKIMTDIFGAALVSAPIEDRPKITNLPSPEELKGKILLKSKNPFLAKEVVHEKTLALDIESSDTSSADSDAFDLKSELEGGVKELKEEFSRARNLMNRVRGRSPSPAPAAIAHMARRSHSPKHASSALLEPAKPERRPPKMSLSLAALLVYTVGVKCRGINKKEAYAPEHMFSLSESTANKYLKQGMLDLIKHSRTHLVRIYPKGTRLSSTNYEPHRYWSAGAQLVAINWQTCDLGYMINHAMFQRNGRAGYVLKPLALRAVDKNLLSKYTKHCLYVTIISGQQIPRPRDPRGREILDKSIIDPYVEVSIHVPEWTQSPLVQKASTFSGTAEHTPKGPSAVTSTTARTLSYKTTVVKNNGFNPVWHETACLPFDCEGDMFDLIFVRFAVWQEGWDEHEPLAVYCTSLQSLQLGYRHLPLHDVQMSQFLFSTLFVKTDVQNA